MKAKFLVPLILCASWLPLRAQTATEVEQLRQQLQQVKDAFEKAQIESRRQIDELTRKLDDVLKKQGGVNAVAVTNAPVQTPEQAALEKQLAAELGAITATNAAAKTTVPTAAQPWTPSQPIPVFRAGQAYMNVSFDALMDFGWSSASDPSAELQLGGHDPTARGFTLPNAEIALDGAVDPYFKGFANIILKLDNDGETEIELEEAYGQTTSLPGNFQLKAGQFFAAFGRQNAQHPHQWGFVDQPLILNRTMGPDGLRNVGAQISWLAPLPFYTEATLGIFNGQGETTTSFRNPGEDDGTGVNRYLGISAAPRAIAGCAVSAICFTCRASPRRLTSQTSRRWSREFLARLRPTIPAATRARKSTASICTGSGSRPTRVRVFRSSHGRPRRFTAASMLMPT
jgi:hypothetical protein